MSSHYFGITDIGKVRGNNEDAFLVEPLKGDTHILAAVIDGVGGYEGGEVAAAIAKDCIEERLQTIIGDETTALKATIFETNSRIIEAKKSESGREKMACVLTIALADTSANQFYYAHVGDTRLYLLRGQSLVKVSKDHSFVGFLEESNRITEQNAMKHPKRNEVNKVLGSDPTIESQQDYIDAGSSPFLPGDILLLCSDGLTDMIGSREITEILTGDGTIPEKAQALINSANNAGGRDNVTVVLVQHPKAPKTHEPTMPVAKKKSQAQAEERVNNLTASSPQRRSNPLLWILSLVCLGLAAALIWQITKPKPTPEVRTLTTETVPPAVAQHPRNASEQQLLYSLNASTNTLVLDTTVFRNAIIVTDTLTIAKDSIHISGNGLVLRGDSAMHGPALFLPPNSRFVSLENIVLENFPIAIMANSSALRLRNVRFINCGIPVLYAFHFADGNYVQGAINQANPFKTDSLAFNH